MQENINADRSMVSEKSIKLKGNIDDKILDEEVPVYNSLKIIIRNY